MYMENRHKEFIMILPQIYCHHESLESNLFALQSNSETQFYKPFIVEDIHRQQTRNNPLVFEEPVDLGDIVKANCINTL